MSEYWVSHKKYFCKYCNIYIADDVPSRRQHESGLRHKGNVERFVRGLYKEGEKRKQDLEEEKREMARVEQAAQAAFARDVGAGLVKPGSSSHAPTASSSSAAPKPAAKPSNPYADYSTAESLGYTDPDAERLQAEAERRRMQGVAGDWEVVSVSESAAAVEDSVAEEANRKREAEQPVDEDDTRRFKLRRKTLGAGLGEIYDPGLIPVKVKKKEESVGVLPPDSIGTVSSTLVAGAEGTKASEKPTWSARGWKRPGEGGGDITTTEGVADNDQNAKDDRVKIEESEAQVNAETAIEPLASQSLETKEEPPAPAKVGEPVTKVEEVLAEIAPLATGGLFRKRKLPAGGTGSRGRRG